MSDVYEMVLVSDNDQKNCIKMFSRKRFYKIWSTGAVVLDQRTK